MVKVGIVGVSGFSGCEALKILLGHKDVRVTYVSANSSEGSIDEMWPELAGECALVCKKFDFKAAIDVDVIFLALPHRVSMEIAPSFLKAGISVIDLSADYRLNDKDLYEKWYSVGHQDVDNLDAAVYGLPELYRADIKKAKLIANPGCYPTAALLGLAPVAAMHGDSITSIAIDAKSGVSGAGRKASIALSHAKVSENFKAYKALNHQHVPEIELYLSKIASKDIKVDFVPHLLPVNRGILETIYVRFDQEQSIEELQKMYEKFYKTEPFVRVMKAGGHVELENVRHTNYCDLALNISEDGKLLVVTSVIDNLSKGAASQAVQNMNIMCGFKETEGLL